MTERERILFLAIVSEHIRTSHPVGSQIIVDKYLTDVSPATIRNDMAKLEERGLIEQPHTSAGRVPTARGYEYYVEHFLPEKALEKRIQHRLRDSYASTQPAGTDRVREVAKTLADLSSESVIVSSTDRDLFYTGLANLFRQPEFAERDVVYNFSEMIDRLDEVMDSIFDQVGPEVTILMGRKNPFGQECGVVLTKYVTANDSGMLGILGPIRMPYAEHRALLQYVQDLLSNHSTHDRSD